jgi:mono/diheme cytochrome c family protein
MKRYILWTLAGLLVLFALIQVVPYGEGRTNPPVVAEPEWDGPQTRELFYRSCVDCHTNETRWPWYSRVAPASWLLQKHVHEGREHLNVSEWGMADYDADEAAEEVREGEMPLPSYLRLHPEARLSDEERATLVRGLEATFGTEEHGPEGEAGERDEHEDG